MTVAAKGESHGLGVGHGSLIEYPDGSVEFRQTGKLLPAFRVNLDDVRGFSPPRYARRQEAAEGEQPAGGRDCSRPGNGAR